MKTILVVVFASLFGNTFGQTAIERTFPLQGAKELDTYFDDPSVVIQTWDKNEVMIKGTISINNGENDSAFELQSSVANGILSITSVIKDKDNLPRHIVIKKGDQEYVFKARSFEDPEVQKFLEENGRSYSYMSNGILIDIKLQMFVPKNMKTSVEARHGTIEFKTFDAPLRIVAKHGKVDATIPPTIGNLTARTKHGEILSNLEVKFDQQPFESRRYSDDRNWTEITTHPGKGPDYYLESKHGTIYLRKP